MSPDLLNPEHLLSLRDDGSFREAFFAMARERHDIMIRKLEGVPKPWSKYKAFQENRFCNVFREDDKTTKWFRENMRCMEFSGFNREVMVLTVVAFRWFNKIEIGQVLMDSAIGLRKGKFDAVQAKERILYEYPKGPFVTGAYIVKTPDGQTKLDGVLTCIGNVARNISYITDMIVRNPTLEASWELLCTYPFLGPFMSYEVVTDLAHTPVLHDAPDRMTWANPGPGATRGISRIKFGGDPDKLRRESRHDRTVMMKEMQLLLEMSRSVHFWPFRTWEMREVEHGLCEFDKLIRVAQGGRMKQRYNGAG